ncbi:hypothetical protein KTR10_03320 [Candidatus Kaiserbacteria bacterium]|nr:hypothetical protein [Candidatus Kaiserbacteria bacterium]
MKKLLVTTTLLATAVSLPATAGATITTKVLDKYLGTNGAVFHSGTVVQSDIFVTLGGGFYTDVWVSYAAQGSWQSTFGDEVDLTLGWADTVGAFNVDVGAAYFNIADDGTGMGDVLQFYLTVDHPIKVGRSTVSPFVRAEVYTSSKSGDNPDNGQFFRGGVMYSTPLAEKWGLSGKAQVSYDTGAFGFTPGTFADVDAKVTYAVTESFSISAYGKISTPISTKASDTRSTETAFGMITSWSF